MPSEIHPAIDLARSHPLPLHSPDAGLPVVVAPTPAPAPENDIVHFSREEALHGADEEESLAEHERSIINTPVNPDKPVFNLAFVSTLGNNEAEVTVRNVFNKEVTKTMKSQDLFMLERQRYAGMKMTEAPTKREGTFGNKALTFIERTWKTTIGKRLHEVKEARVGANLMIAAGVDTAITAEFDAVIDQKARENIGKQRDNWFKQLTGNIRDLGNEIIGREKDLHREKIKLTTDLRNEYIQDPNNSKHPYAELLNRDMVAREAVAEKFATTPVDFLGEHGDKAREVALAPDSPVAKFLQEQIFKKVIADAISQSDAGTYDGKNGGISAGLRPELDKTLKDYFFSDEFTAWRNGLSDEDKKVFENSLTYTNNVLAQAETVLMPMVHDHLTYFKTNQDIAFDIKLKLGTGQFGPNNEVVGTSIFSKERISKNASLYEKLRQQINGDQSKLYNQGDISKGLKQEMMMAALNAVVSNEVVAAAVGGTIGGAAKMLLRSSVSWLPILGSGLVAGGVAGAKEYSNLGTMRERFGGQVAEGYTHPVGINAVRAEALRKVDYHRVDLGLRSEQLLHVAKQIKGGDKSEETILQTLGYLADSKARVALSDKRHINLFHASTDTATGRGVYQKQEALHTQARVLATTKLHELLNGNDALRTQIATKIGFIPTATSEQILDGLSAFQGEFLEHGTTVNINIQEALKAVNSADVKSIVGQDKAFQSWRWKEVRKRAATTAVIAGATAGLMKLGINEYNVLHEEVIKTVEHKVHTIIDQSVTSHASPLSIGEVQDPSTNEIIASMTAHIPKGTSLVSDLKTPGAYDLVLTNEPHRVLVDNMTFTDDGVLNMTTEVRESLAHAHIDYHAVSTGEIEIGAPDSSFVGTETLRFGDLPGAHEGGFDQWFANTLNHSYRVSPEPEVAGQMVVERTTQINGLREMLYAWEDHEKFLGHTDNFRLIEEPGYHQVMHIDDATGRYLSEPQANGFFMDNVPKIFTSEEGHRKIADFINESVRLKLSGGEMTQAQEIAYTMSYDGTPGSVPTPEEFEILMAALGENSTETVAKTVATHDAWFTMTDDLVDIQTVTTTEVINHTIPVWTENAANLAFSTSVPLEAPIGKVSNPGNQYPERYRSNEFANGSRLRDIIRAGNSNDLLNSLTDRGSQYYNSSYPRPESISTESRTEGQRIIERIAEAAKNADRIYVTLGGPIGDAIVGANYVTSLREATRVFGKNIPITVIVSEHHKDLFRDMGTNINVEVANSGKLKEYVSNMIDTRLDKNPLILDFGQYSANIPTYVQSTRNGKNITVVNDLLPPAIELYTNSTDGDARYTHFVEDILGMNKDSISAEASKFVLKLPQNNQQTYDDLSLKYGIDKSKEQIGIVVEASSDEKRYPLTQWLDMINKLAVAKPEVEFTIMFNDKSGNTAFNNSALTTAIARLPLPLRSRIHLFPGNLIETAIVMSHQSSVISNDTGLAHIAGHIENGPKVVSLHLSKFSPDMWVSNKKRQTAVVAAQDQPISSISVDEILTKIA